MLSRSVSGYEIEGWKGCREEGEDGANDFYFPSSSWNRALRAAPKWLPAWLNVVKNGRALPPNLTGIFLYKKKRERKVMNPIFQHHIIRSFPRGWIVAAILHDLLFVSGSILGFKKGDIFFSPLRDVFTSLEISSIFIRVFKYWIQMYLRSKRFLLQLFAFGFLWNF